MVRSHLEYETAKKLYEEHGIVTYPCPDEGADLITMSGLRIEVKRGQIRRFNGARHGDLMNPPPLHLRFDDRYALSCALTKAQQGDSVDYLVAWVRGHIYVLHWDEVESLIYKPMLYIPAHCIMTPGPRGLEEVARGEVERWRMVGNR